MSSSSKCKLKLIALSKIRERLAEQAVVLLIRHAESEWNVWESLFDTTEEPVLFDALFSPDGRTQLCERRATLHSLLDGILPDLMILSPLSRAIETGLRLFGSSDASTIEWQQGDRGHRIQISALFREHLEDSCDIGSPPSVLKERYPQLPTEELDQLDDRWFLPSRHRQVTHDLKFSGEVQHFQDQCWQAVLEHGRETEEETDARVAEFEALLVTLKDKHRLIVVVGHGNALWSLTQHYASKHGDQWYFKNCEAKAFIFR